MEGPRWHVWIDDGDAGHRSFRSFEDAEKHARAVARHGKRVEITDDEHNTLAWVRLDALDRLWTDVCAPGLIVLALVLLGAIPVRAEQTQRDYELRCYRHALERDYSRSSQSPHLSSACNTFHRVMRWSYSADGEGARRVQ